jgi:opacity protein-like surface antigen
VEDGTALAVTGTRRAGQIFQPTLARILLALARFLLETPGMKRVKSSSLSSAAAMLALGFLLNLTALEGSRAGAPAAASASTVTSSPLENHFQSGVYEASAGCAILFSPFVATDNRPTVNYQLTELTLGYMLTPVRGSRFWRGNFEVAGSAFGGPIFEGQGSYVAGIAVWGRYNFVPRSGHFVPFLQVGMGLTETDVDRRLEGQNFNFNLNAGLGTRYFISPNWSVNAEYRYQHISNANLSSRNVGVNADGPVLSLSYFF